MGPTGVLKHGKLLNPPTKLRFSPLGKSFMHEGFSIASCHCQVASYGNNLVIVWIPVGYSCSMEELWKQLWNSLGVMSNTIPLGYAPSE